MKITIVLIILISLFILPAESDGAETEENPDTVVDGNVVEGNVAEGNIVEEKVEELEKASGSGLRKKRLSKAFEQFIPSEKISADNAVPFPVDI
ncbi:MAG: hypothetical protein ACI9CE_002200 [Flavobacterium sp.]|jgi:hypothetical protein